MSHRVRTRRFVASVMLILTWLASARAEDPKPPGPRTVDTTMLGVSMSRGVATVDIGIGKDAGLADGDEVRLECERLVGYVLWVQDDRAAFRISEEALRGGPGIARARITLGRARSEPWCPSGRFVGSEPDAAKVTVDVRVRTLLADGDHVLMSVFGGGERGVAVGDEIRLPCIDAVARIVEVNPYVARARVSARALGARATVADVRVTLRGQPSDPWCPAGGERPERVVDVADGWVDAGVLTPLETGGATMPVVVDRGAIDGIALGDRVRVPCYTGVGKVVEVYALRSKVMIDTEGFARDRANKTLRITLGGKPAPRWCPKKPRP